MSDSIKEKAQKVWQLYEHRKRNDEFEPPWVHSAYELVKQLLNGTIGSQDRDMVESIIESHDLKDGHIVDSGFGGTVMHDGWKVGTTTWIFMGRKFCVPERIANGWVMVSRTMPADIAKMFDTESTTAWMAYHPKCQIGFSAMSSNCIGPCLHSDEVREMARHEAV